MRPPLYVTILGAVDSGKTTFFKHYTKIDVKQPNSRTESVRFFPTKIGDAEVVLVDCPGHELFNYHKSIGVELSDLVLYFVDAKNPNTSILKELKALKIPVMVVLNKMDEFFSKDIPLREYLRNQNLSLLYDGLDKVNAFGSHLNVFLFSEIKRASDLESESNIYYFPVSIRSQWGLSQFNIFFSKISLTVRRNPKSYLYGLYDTQDRTYVEFINRTSNGLVSKELMYFKKHFLTDPTSSSFYTCNKQIQQKIRSYGLLCLQDLLVKSQISLPLISEPKFFIESLKAIAKSQSFKSLQVMVYGDTHLRRKVLGQIFTELKLKWSYIRRPEWDKETKNKLYVFWMQSPINTESPNVVRSNSLYKLMDILKERMIKVIESDNKIALLDLKDSFLFGRLYPEHLFSSSSNRIVIGAEIFSGRLSVKSKLLFVDREFNPVNEAIVECLQKNNRSLSELKDANQLVSAKLKFTKKPDLDKFYFVNSAFFDRNKVFKKLISIATPQIVQLRDLLCLNVTGLETYLHK